MLEVVKCGVIVVDNISVFCMIENVLFVVFEVNENDLKEYNGIIVNLNCFII